MTSTPPPLRLEAMLLQPSAATAPPPSFDDLQVQPAPASAREERAVLSACQPSTGRKFRLVPLGPADAPKAATLRKEVERFALLRDPHVVPAFGTLVRDGLLYAVAEDVEGEHLELQLRQAHRFTTEEILHIAEGMAQALRAAGEHGFLHRDLRPSAVILTKGGAVQVRDLGPLGVLHPITERPLGVAYLSPEQARGDALDARSNIYSLGAILYELSTGRPPFEGYDSSTSLLYQLAHMDPVSPRQAGASIPREVERVVLRCLAKAPQDRYADASKLLEALQTVRHSLSSSSLAAISKEEDTGDFDIYEDQPLGEGGMGTLVRGRQHSLDRIVAIKIIREAFNTHPEFLQRFRREAELLAQVDNSNVVQVIGTGVWRGRLFYAMELVKGEDLAARALRGHRFRPDEVLHIAEGVANALRAAWRYKIVHRDIKPSNIMLTFDGTVKVTDFGLAKSLRIPGHESHVLAGTPEYLSPEQGLGQPVDIRADIYALGVVLYELVSGRHPFKDAQSSIAMIYQHVHTAPPALESVGSAAPVPLCQLIQRCLAKKPEERYENPDVLLAAIRQARKALGVSPAPPVEPPAVKQRRPRRWAAWTAGGLVLAGLLAGAWWTARPSGSDAFRAAYELALGLGDNAEALRLAELHRGAGSPEAAEAAGRLRRQRYARLEQAALARVAERNWEAAAEAYAALLALAPPDSAAQIQAAIGFCRDLAEAAACETRKDWEGALRIYTRLAGLPAAETEYLNERIRAARLALDASRPR